MRNNQLLANDGIERGFEAKNEKKPM